MKEHPANQLMSIDPFQDVFPGFLRPWIGRSEDTAPRICVELSENDNHYVIKAEVPGVAKDAIDVRIDGNQVSISAEVKKHNEDKKDGRVLRSERHYGYASRSLWLDNPVDSAKSVAKYQDGVLELTLPKKTASSSQRLAIS